MEMRKCMNGHYYDASVNTECPYCKGSAANTGKTVAVNYTPSNDFDSESKTVPMGYNGGGNIQQAINNAQTSPQPVQVQQPSQSSMTQALKTKDDDDGKTIAVVHQDMGIDPVVGWLVSINGKEKGRDYRIHSDNNYIGRSDKMDIVIRGDETVSRENHAVISYDSIDKTYYFSPGEGRNIVRYNSKAIFQTVELKAYDKVIVGKTELLFVPLCGDSFEWSNEDADI